MLLIGLVACGSDSDVLSYDEFKAQAHQEPDTGLYVINGDELVETEEAMQALYDSYLESVADAEDRAAGLSEIEQTLIVNRVGGADDRWPSGTAQNLTYCISQSSFGSRYSAVVSAMNSAASAWESAGRVNFVHASAHDGNCNSR